jgi:hypothetical protein
LFLVLAISISVAQEPGQPVFRAETGLVQVYATIVDQSGKPISNLPLKAVRVSENGVPQQVRFVGQENVPVAATLALDGDARPEPVRAAVSALLGAIKFAEPVRVARFDSPPERASEALEVRSNVEIVPMRPRTPMRDALLMLVRGMQANGSEVKRTLMVVADGESYRSWHGRESVIGAAREKDVSIYAIEVTPPPRAKPQGAFNRAADALRGALIWVIDLLDDDVPSPAELSAELARLTSATGGEACSAPDENAAVACVQRFASDVKSQYVIAYRPTTLARKDRKIEISIEGHPDAVVRVRKASGTYGQADRTESQQ